MLVTFHFDPTCPWTWVTSRWLVRAAEVEPELEVRWAPFSLAHLNAGNEIPERFRPRIAAGRAALRIVEHLVAAGDQDGVARFYDAFGDRLHRAGKDASELLVTDAAEAAGLDSSAIAAAGDEALDAAVDASTDRAYAGAGPDVGSPVLHWSDDDGGDVWIFGPLFDRVPEAACAAELWIGVRNLAVHGMFKELKRGRTGPPDLTTS